MLTDLPSISAYFYSNFGRQVALVCHIINVSNLVSQSSFVTYPNSFILRSQPTPHVQVVEADAHPRARLFDYGYGASQSPRR